MAFNGSGVFNRLYNWVADAAALIDILPTRMDAEMDGFATGLTNCITKDGQTTTTDLIPFGQGINVTASAPASPASGDVWATTTGVYARTDGISSLLARSTRTVQVLTTATGTWTRPTGCRAIVVEMVGGGGGGGYGNSATGQAAVGAGGGGGAYAIKLFNSPAATVAYSCGAGGTAGVASSSTAGGAGGDTTWDSPATVTAGGGAGGSGSSSTTTVGGSAIGAAGGTATGGDLNVPGGNGFPGIVYGATVCIGGAGGSSRWGTGGNFRAAVNSGAQGTGYGAGASGAASTNNSDADGSTGTAGRIVVWEFY